MQIIKKCTVANPNVEQLAEVIAMPTRIWKRKGNIFYAFSATQDENGKRNVLELNMKRTVVKSFLRAGALSHIVVIDCSQQDIEELKSLIKTAPEFDRQRYRWPWDSGNKVKFTSKRDLNSEFQFV